MANNEQIDKTSYYLLPCGKYLEDFIAWKRLDFATGSALKYFYRAGKKDGEDYGKDLAKAVHYIIFIAGREGKDTQEVRERIRTLADFAMDWDGVEERVVKASARIVRGGGED